MLLAMHSPDVVAALTEWFLTVYDPSFVAACHPSLMLRVLLAVTGVATFGGHRFN